MNQGMIKQMERQREQDHERVQVFNGTLPLTDAKFSSVYVLIHHGDSCEEVMMLVINAFSEKQARDIAQKFDGSFPEKWTKYAECKEPDDLPFGLVAFSVSGC